MRTFAFVVGFLMIGCASTSETGLANAALSSDAPPEEVSGESLGHYMAAVIYQRIGDEENSLRELRAAADLTPRSTWLQQRLLLAYYRMGQFEDASIMAERAVKNEPESISLRIWLGQIYFQLERFDDAIDTFTEAIDLDPTRAMGYEALDDIQSSTNDLVGTLRVYEKLAKRNPDAPLLQLRLGLNLIRVNDSPAAAKALERTLELQPDMARAAFLLGIVNQDLGNYEEAIENFDSFLETQPDHRNARLNLAGSHVHLGNFPRALEILNQLIEANEGDASLYLHRTQLWLRSGTLPDAGHAAAPSNAPLIGTLLEAMARHQEGEPYSPLIASLDSLEGDMNGEFGAYGFEMMQLFGEDETGDFFEEQFESMNIDVEDSKAAAVFRARVYMARAEYTEARALMNSIVEHHGSDRMLHYHLASICEELKLRDEVERHLRKCLEINPQDSDSMNFLGYMFAEENKNLDEAEELLEKALLLEPDNGFFLDSLGWVHYKKGDAEKAVDLIRRAVRSSDMASDDAVLRSHLGDAYLLKGDKKSAVAEWSRAIRLDPEVEGIAEKLKKYQKRQRD